MILYILFFRHGISCFWSYFAENMRENATIITQATRMVKKITIQNGKKNKNMILTVKNCTVILMWKNKVTKFMQPISNQQIIFIEKKNTKHQTSTCFRCNSNWGGYFWICWVRARDIWRINFLFVQAHAHDRIHFMPLHITNKRFRLIWPVMVYWIYQFSSLSQLWSKRLLTRSRKRVKYFGQSIYIYTHSQKKNDDERQNNKNNITGKYIVQKKWRECKKKWPRK